MYKLGLEKAEEPEIKCQHLLEKAREFQKSIYFCFIDYAKAFHCVDYNKLWKILKVMGVPEHLTCLLRNVYSVKTQLKPDMEQQTGSQLGKKFDMIMYCHLAYLISMKKSTSCEMPGWMKHKLESRLLAEIPTI